ncbi:MAG: 16S rRNA (cytidine(1402)-2'-O)-methyltransferase [Pseudomonadota bacterium]|nr:16S rRNA (cytidine(1402)-2'-O)-methyltransferase [Pseudomonadota bacterium]
MLLTDLNNNKKIEVCSGLYIVSTPIGNRYDITYRALYILNRVNVVVCEDTRVTKRLFKILNIAIKDKKWISYNDHNASLKIDLIIGELKKNKVVSLVSDAGTPLISDPGYKLIQSVIKNKIRITPVPGVSAVTTSLIVSGAKTDKFSFLGFLPKNKRKYIETLKEYSGLKTTLIIFESSIRLKYLIKSVFQDYKKAKLFITRELTKIHEEVIYVDISNFEKYIKNGFNFKGEITIALELNNISSKNMIYTNSELLKKLKKYKPSQVASMLSKNSEQSREEIYKRCITLTK